MGVYWPGVEINENLALKDSDIDEIKSFAKSAGEEDLSSEDIRYGVTYGRSVIADYVA